MAKVFIKTHGCQMNEYDSSRMADMLKESQGFEQTEIESEADLLLLNTCSIREKAQEKVFHQLGRWSKLKSLRPGVKIGVGGCVASQEGSQISKRAPYVDVIFGPQTLHRLPNLIKDAEISGQPQVDVSFPEIEKFDRLPQPRADGPTAFVSIMESNSYGGIHLKFDLSGYRQILFDTNLFDEMEFNPAYLIIIGRSFLLAVAATIISLIIGFPVAYYISRQKDSVKNILIFLVTIPFWTNLLIRTFAWIIILGKDGVIENSFGFIGIIGDDDSLNLMYTNIAILIGLVYSYIPLMVLPIYSSMEKLDVRLIEAASDLYSTRINLIFKIILPLTLPGIIGGSILVFVPCLGAFIAPDLLGGGKKLLLGSLIQFQFAYARNWPFGAAIAMVLLALIVTILYLNARVNRRHEQNA